MPRKTAPENEQTDKETIGRTASVDNNTEEITKLNKMLAAVLHYISDDEIEEIDIEYLLKNTEGLQEWWDQYREANRKQIEDEIKHSLADLSLGELERIREQIKDKKQ